MWKTAPALVALCVASPAGAAPDSAHTYDALNQAAAQARESGDLERTLGLLREAYQLEPSPGLLNNIARVLEELGRYREASELYTRVVLDPAADPQLRERDEARRDVIGPRLATAWLRMDQTPEDAEVLLDGEPLARRGELAVAPGVRVIEARRRGSTEVALLFVATERGSTSHLRLDPRAEVLLDCAPERPIARFEVNRYPLRTPLPSLRVLRLEPGMVRIALSPERQLTTAVLTLSSTLSAGAPVRLSSLLPPLPPPVSLEATAPPPGAAVGPVLAGGVAAAVATGGAVLLALSGHDRATINGAERDSRGVVIGLTEVEASRLDARATTESRVGVTLLAASVLGGGVALLWHLLDAPEPAPAPARPRAPGTDPCRLEARWPE